MIQIQKPEVIDSLCLNCHEHVVIDSCKPPLPYDFELKLEQNTVTLSHIFFSKGEIVTSILIELRLIMNSFCLWLVLISVFVQYSSVKGWDNEELEIFDLVEEIGVGVSFYKVLGVEQV